MNNICFLILLYSIIFHVLSNILFQFTISLFELHEVQNDFSLAPEKLPVSSDMLSNYCKKIADKYEIKVAE